MNNHSEKQAEEVLYACECTIAFDLGARPPEFIPNKRILFERKTARTKHEYSLLSNAFRLLSKEKKRSSPREKGSFDKG